MEKEHVWKGAMEINTCVLICYSLDVCLLGIYVEEVFIGYRHGAQCIGVMA